MLALGMTIREGMPAWENTSWFTAFSHVFFFPAAVVLAEEAAVPHTPWLPPPTHQHRGTGRSFSNLFPSKGAEVAIAAGASDQLVVTERC